MDNQQIVKNTLDYTLFSWTKQGGLNPINASHAKGSYVYDREGKKYLDFSSQLMNVNIGHGRQEITGNNFRWQAEFTHLSQQVGERRRNRNTRAKRYHVVLDILLLQV